MSYTMVLFTNHWLVLVSKSRSVCVLLLTVNATDKILQLVHLQLDAGLSECVIVLDAVEELREAPEAVSLKSAGGCLRQVDHFVRVQFRI